MEILTFVKRADFRKWLTENVQREAGVWLLFGKTKKIPTLKAGEALEEALCFGWIDGQMKKIDADSYLKYFSPRRKNSKWSEKNKKIVQKLITEGLMTEFGEAQIQAAKDNGQWQKATGPQPVTPQQIAELAEILKKNTTAYKNFQGMSPSVQKNYTRAYFDAKTESGRLKRLAWLSDRVEKNLKPM